MRFSANNHRRRHSQRRGASLIEVLVVLVILVVGIFSIARLFPGGFIAIRSAENNTFADRLAQAQFETLKQNDAFLLDAVYMYSRTSGFMANVSPDDLSGTTASPYAGDATLNLNDINKARYIQGESFTIPTANVGTDNNGVSIHTLNYGPIKLPLQPFITLPPGTPPAIAGLPPIHSAPWASKMGNSQQTVTAVPTDTTNTYNTPGGYENPSDLYTANQPNYAVDYTGQRIALPPATYPQYFTFIVKRQATVAGGATSIVTFYYPLVLPASDTSGVDSATAYDGGWFDPTASTYAGSGPPAQPINGIYTTDVPINGAPGPWSTGTAVLDRTFYTEPADPSGLAATLTDMNAEADPYRYVLLNPAPTPSTVNLTLVSLGTLAFNPRLAGQKVSVSYLAYDWHIIHEDVDVPDTPGTPIRLTLNHVKRVGDVQSDQTIYNGLFNPSDTSSVGSGNDDIVILDTDTGDTAGLSVTDTSHVFDLDNASGSAAMNQVAISYDGGRITLPTDTTSPWYAGNHKHLRIFYEGDLDWAVAIQKAPSLYTAGDPTAQVAAYAINGLRLDFPRCDLGNVVSVDNITYVDSSGSSHQVTNASGTIAVDQFSADANPSIDLSPFLPNAATSQPAGGFQIGDVKGISARSVVIWKEHSNWKSRSLDTILTRAQ